MEPKVVVVSIGAVVLLISLICVAGALTHRTKNSQETVSSAPTDLSAPLPAVTPSDMKLAAAEDPGPAEAEETEAYDPRPRKGDKGRLTAESEGEDVFEVKNPDAVWSGATRLQFNDRCCADAITCVVVGFLGEDVLVRAVAVDAAGPLTVEEEPCAACPVGLLFLVDPVYWLQYAENLLEYEADLKTIEAEKAQIRRLLRQEKRQIVEQE